MAPNESGNDGRPLYTYTIGMVHTTPDGRETTTFSGMGGSSPLPATDGLEAYRTAVTNAAAALNVDPMELETRVEKFELSGAWDREKALEIPLEDETHPIYGTEPPRYEEVSERLFPSGDGVVEPPEGWTLYRVVGDSVVYAHTGEIIEDVNAGAYCAIISKQDGSSEVVLSERGDPTGSDVMFTIEDGGAPEAAKKRMHDYHQRPEIWSQRH